jgi:very-short-patch-repair endonuclease
MSKVSTKNMTEEERRKYLQEIGRRGGLKRAKAFTSVYQRRARANVSRESCRRNGARGARRTIELHGYTALFEGARRKRLAKPSQCDLVMIGILKTLGLKYKREYPLGETLFTLDFFLPKLRVGIEVDGSIHDEGKPDYERRKEQEARKARICSCLRIDLVRIHHSELGDDLAGAIAKIREIAGCSGDC